MADGALLANTEDVDAEDAAVLNPCDDWEKGSLCPTSGSWGIAIGANGANDVVKLSTLLRAAGIDSLDSRTHTPPYRTRRHKGVVVLLRIHYDNSWATKFGIFPDTSKYRYRYTVIDVPDEGYEVRELRSELAVSRTIFYRHGVRIVIKQTGDIGAFSWTAVLVCCTTSIGLFAVSRLVVDMLLDHLKRFDGYQDIFKHKTEKNTEKTLGDVGRAMKSKVKRQSTAPSGNAPSADKAANANCSTMTVHLFVMQGSRLTVCCPARTQATAWAKESMSCSPETALRDVD